MRTLLPLLIMIIFLAFLAWANIYLARSFNNYFGFIKLKTFYFLFAFITIFMIGGLAGFTNSLSLAGSMLYKLAATLMGVLLFLLISLLLVDLITLFVKIKPLVHGILVVSLTLSVSVYGILNAYNTRVSMLEIPVKGLKKETEILHLTDIHIGHFRGPKFLTRIVRKANNLDPDIVVITGDLFDGRIRLKQEVLSPLEELRAPVYFVDGNHDGYTGVEKVKELVRNAGIEVLENRLVDLDDIQLVGLNHMLPDSTTTGMHAALSKNTIKNTLPELNIDKVKPSVLLHHSPDGIEYANDAGIDVYLAGHTHGGQLFPVNFINDLIFKYNKGLHSYKGTSIFVSYGAGTFGPPMRVGTRSEIALIKLVPEKK